MKSDIRSGNTAAGTNYDNNFRNGIGGTLAGGDKYIDESEVILNPMIKVFEI